MIPIVKNHSSKTEDLIGRFDDGFVTFITPVDRNDVFDIFGNVGYKLLQSEDNGDVVKMRIFEWSHVSFMSEYKEKLRRDAYIVCVLKEVYEHKLTYEQAALKICRLGSEYK